MSTVLRWHDYMKMVHWKDANILIWSDCLHDKHRVSSELWAIDTSSAGLWACAAFVALTHMCSDYGATSSLQHCWVATVVAHVTYHVCLPLLTHHPLHGLHALCSLQRNACISSFMRAFMMAAAAAPSDGCPPLSPPMWCHCVPLDQSWAGWGTGMTYMAKKTLLTLSDTPTYISCLWQCVQDRST